MPHSLFISDLHLCATHPATTQSFRHFMREIAPQAEALYILGDLFEYWAGDDDLDSPFNLEICTVLKALVQHGTAVFIMHGNRDLLMGQELAQACNATLLADPVLLNLYGQPTLLSHGDALCTDDAAYQAFRQQVRDKKWQQQFLSQPLAQRKAFIEQARSQSESEKQLKSNEIMDVNPQAVNALLQEHNYPRLIHGHTHRPARHLHQLEGHSCERWVLGDWDRQANALRCDASGMRWEQIENL